MPKILFVTGGVMSSLGKGIVSSSLGMLLKARGHRVTILKFDPYLNVDAGSQNPFQHGEVFVTEDGAETDLDLGHYERFLRQPLGRMNNVTTGSLYQSVLSKERRGDFLGSTVQIIPHLTQEIKSRILALVDKTKSDIVICEIGGTVGDIESGPFLEAIRQFGSERSSEDVLYLHVTYVPYLKITDELKTKPTQHSVNELRRSGIKPNVIACRCEIPVTEEVQNKIAMFCDVAFDYVYSVPDLPSVYEVPIMFEDQEMPHQLMRLWGMLPQSCDINDWKAMVSRMKTLEKEVKVAMIGKYSQLTDAYLSVNESLKHAGIYTNRKVEIDWIEAERLETESVETVLDGYDGIIVPGGFGYRGIEGKINTAKYARENNVPYLGLCLGLHMLIIEFARNVCHLENANSTEFRADTEYPVIDVMTDQKYVTEKGGTMRLGAQPCELEDGSLASRIYRKKKIYERHRHRFEVNNKYKDIMKEKGIVYSGINPNLGLAEIAEIADHPFMIGVQFHPEFQSNPLEPHPLFESFVKAIIKQKENPKPGKLNIE